MGQSPDLSMEKKNESRGYIKRQSHNRANKS